MHGGGVGYKPISDKTKVIASGVRNRSSGGSRIFLRGGAKGRGVNNHGLGVATKYCALERKMYPGSGASPQPLFTVIMLLRRVFVVFISSGRRKTPPLVAMNI